MPANKPQRKGETNRNDGVGGRRAATKRASQAEPANDRIARVRRFNRFYTRQLGFLREAQLSSAFSLASHARSGTTL